jgi:hypothetical protein
MIGSPVVRCVRIATATYARHSNEVENSCTRQRDVQSFCSTLPRTHSQHTLSAIPRFDRIASPFASAAFSITACFHLLSVSLAALAFLTFSHALLATLPFPLSMLLRYMPCSYHCVTATFIAVHIHSQHHSLNTSTCTVRARSMNGA